MYFMNIPINPQMQEWSKIDLGALAQRTRADSKKIQGFIEVVRTPKSQVVHGIGQTEQPPSRGRHLVSREG